MFPLRASIASVGSGDAAPSSSSNANSFRNWRPPEQPLIGISEFGLFAGLRPSVTNSRDLVLDQLKRFSLVEQEDGGCSKAGGEEATVVFAANENGLRGLVTRAILGEDIVCGS